MEIFTFVLDFKGGTYIAQLVGSLTDACSRWAETLDVSAISSFEEKDKLNLTADISKQEPTSIKGMQNVWCLSTLIGDELALLHIVKTDSGAIQNPKSKIQNRDVS